MTPWLLAAFPVLSLWRRNFDAVSASDVPPALLAAGILGAVVWALSWLVARKKSGAVVMSVVGLACFYGFAPLAVQGAKWLPESALHPVTLGLMLGTLIGAGWWVRNRSLKLGATFLWCVALLLVAWEGAALAWEAWRFRADGARATDFSAATELAGGASANTAAGVPPDIYYIVLDGYARADVMKELYGYDNGEFLEALRQMGFHVCSQSRANYVKTLPALSAVFNMAYVQEVVPVPEDWPSSRQLLGSIQSNRVVHLLRQLGYSIHSFNTGYSLAEFSNPDYHYRSDLTWSEFHGMLLRGTPLPALLGSRADPHERHRRSLRFILDRLPEIHDGKQPRFVFAHLLAPHPPFVLGRDGEAVDPQRPFGYYDGSDYMKRDGTLQQYRHGYAEQARYVSKRVAGIVAKLLEQAGSNPPIIIIQSDHGPGSLLDWSSLYDTDLRERLGILMALHLPGYAGLELDAAFSPVNVFRLVFDLYFGTELGPLEARSYYTFQSQPYRYFDVTDPQNAREGKPAPTSRLGP